MEQVCCGRAEASGGGGEEYPGECSSLNPGGHGNQQECSGSAYLWVFFLKGVSSSDMFNMCREEEI